jgi:hypothetical protein
VFGEEAPGFTEVHFVGLFDRDPHGATLVDLGLAVAVLLGDLADLKDSSTWSLPEDGVADARNRRPWDTARVAHRNV